MCVCVQYMYGRYCTLERHSPLPCSALLYSPALDQTIRDDTLRAYILYYGMLVYNILTETLGTSAA